MMAQKNIRKFLLLVGNIGVCSYVVVQGKCKGLEIRLDLGTSYTQTIWHGSAMAHQYLIAINQHLLDLEIIDLIESVLQFPQVNLLHTISHSEFFFNDIQ